MKKTLTFLVSFFLCVIIVNAQGNQKTTIQYSSGGSSACDTDMYEPNNDVAKATSINPNDVLLALICDAYDIDWYEINIPSNTANFKVKVSDCPKDYDVEVYDNTSKNIGGSHVKGYTNEVVSINNPAPGTYYIKVFGYNKAFDINQTYAIRYHITANPVAVSNAPALRTQTTETGNDIEMYPNPAVNYVKLKYTTENEGLLVINIYDHVGKLINKLTDLHGEGLNAHNIDVSYLSNGFYMIEVIADNRKQLKKLTIDRR